MKLYTIWRRQMPEQGYPSPRWIETSHAVYGRTQKEADSRMRRRFKGCGFHGMSLLASAFDPNLLNPDYSHFD